MYTKTPKYIQYSCKCGVVYALEVIPISKRQVRNIKWAFGELAYQDLVFQSLYDGYIFSIID